LRRRRLGDDAGRTARRGERCVAIYFTDAALAAAFVSRWCAGPKTEVSDGAFQVRKDEPAPRVQARPHTTF
jgi:hypothetical protein